MLSLFLACPNGVSGACSARNESHNQTQMSRLFFAAGAIALAWLGIGVIGLGIVLGLARPEVRIDLILAAGFGMLIVCGIVGFVAGASIRCPSCRARVLQEPRGPVHHRVVPIPMLNYWASAIVRVLRGQQLFCWHCGSAIVTDGANPVVAPIDSPSMPRLLADELLMRHRFSIIAGNGMYIVGLALALALYQWGGFAATGWRPVAIGVGFAWSSIGIVVAATSWMRGYSVREAITAYATSQNMPLAVLYALTVVGFVLLTFFVVAAER